MKIGIAGIGKMGNAIGSRLLGLGHSVSCLEPHSRQNNRLGQCRRSFGGTPKLLAESVDVVSHCSPTKPPSTTFILARWFVVWRCQPKDLH
jgi:phosphoglycerate dehydrogenase-like enzyme